MTSSKYLENITRIKIKIKFIVKKKLVCPSFLAVFPTITPLEKNKQRVKETA